MSAWFVRLIKIQQRWVRFSAIDAWILIEVSIDLGRKLLATLDSISPDASCIRRAAEIPRSSVLPVVLASVRGETFPTPRLQLRRAAPVETRRRLHLAAFRARSREGEHAVTSISRE
jgi:hypothetical protein